MTEAYKVGITIALTNQISRGLMLIQGDLAKTNAQALKLNATLKEIKLLGIGGAILGGMGFLGLEALKPTYEAAKKYEQVYNQFKALDLGDVINKQADKFAKSTQLIGNSATDLMAALRDMHLVVNDYGEAKMLAPLIAQMEYANKAVGGEKGGSFDRGQSQAMAKVMEWRGGFQSVAAMNLQADYMQHVMSGTSFQVLPRDYRNFLATGSTAAQQMNNEAFYYKSEPLIQMMGGGAVGTGLMTAYNRLVLGMSAGSPGGKAYLELLDKLHLIKPGYIEKNGMTGKITKILPNFLKDTDLEENDPYAFLENKLVPALTAAGYDERHVETAIAQIYGRVGGKVMNQFHQRYIHGKIDSAVKIDANAMGVGALVKLAQSSPQGAEKALGAAWESLKIAAGEALIPVVIPALMKLADAFRDLGKWINQHPVKFDYLIKGFAGLSAALMFGGSLLIVTAGLRGLALLVTPLRLLVTPITALAGIPLAGIATGIGLIGGALTALASIVYHKEIANWIDSKAPAVGDALMKTSDFLSGMKPSNSNRSYVPPSSSGSPIQVNTAVNLDGKQIATVVSNHQYNTANTPASSSSGFDTRQSFTQPGFSGSW